VFGGPATGKAIEDLCRSAPVCTQAQPKPIQTNPKPDQGIELGFSWILLDSFVRLDTFQWVMSDPIKNSARIVGCFLRHRFVINLSPNALFSGPPTEKTLWHGIQLMYTVCSAPCQQHGVSPNPAVERTINN
jgi:hypothetical protein